MASTLKVIARAVGPDAAADHRAAGAEEFPSTSCRKSPAWGSRASRRIWDCCRKRGCCNRGARASGPFTNCSRARTRRRSNSSNWPFAARRNCPSTPPTRSISSASCARRNEQAQLYFNQVAGRFDRSYGPGRSWQAFGQLLLRMLPPLVVADLGSGEGLLSELLARRAKKVIAVDNSEKMVAFGANKGEEEQAEEPRIPPGRSGKSADRTAAAWTW